MALRPSSLGANEQSFQRQFRRKAFSSVMVSTAAFALTATVLTATRIYMTGPGDDPIHWPSVILILSVLWSTPIALWATRERSEQRYPLFIGVALAVLTCLVIWAWSRPGVTIERVHIGMLIIIPFATIFFRLPFAWAASAGTLVYCAGAAVILVRFSNTAVALNALISTFCVAALALFVVQRYEMAYRDEFRAVMHSREQNRRLENARQVLMLAQASLEEAQERTRIAQEAHKAQYERKLKAIRASNKELEASNLRQQKIAKDLLNAEALIKAQLTARARMAEEATANKTIFMERVAHDLRQPLTGIQHMAAAAERFLQRNEYTKVQEVFPHLLRAVNAMVGTFGAMLDISKLENGVTKLTLGPTNLYDVLQSVQNLQAPIALKKGLPIRMKNLTKPPLYAHSEGNLLRRVLMNLVTNAIKFTPVKDEHSGVLVGAVHVNGVIRIDVYDTGIGFDAAQGRRIWEQFVKLNEVTDDDDCSSGMGLAIVKAACDALGHKIDYRSRPGMGSRFSLYLTVGEQPAFDCFDLDLDYGTDLDGAKVLLVENHPSARHGLETMMEAWKMNVVSASGLKELDALLERGLARPSVLVTDHKLEPGTGMDVVERVHQHFLDEIPTVVVTGDYALPTTTYAELQHVDILNKPVDPEDLADALKRALARSEPLGTFAAWRSATPSV